MAYIPRQLPQSQQNQFGREEETTAFPLPPQTGGSSGTAPGGSGNSTNAAPGMGTSTQFGSNAAKLSDYLSANKEQIGQYGQKLAGEVSQGYNDAKGAVDQSFGNFSQQVGQYKPNQDTINQAFANPVDFVKDPSKVSSFTGWLNNEYSGPQNFQTDASYGDISGKVNKAVEQANMVDNYSGLGEFMNKNVNQQNYTPGMKTLDTALVARNPEAWGSIKAAAQPGKGLNDYLSGKTQEANTLADTTRQDVNSTRANMQNKLTGDQGLIPTFQNNLNQKVQTTEAQRLAYNEQYNNKFGKPSEELSKRINEYNAAVAANPLPFNDKTKTMALTNRFSDLAALEPVGSPIGVGNVASADDQAMQSALNMLSGGNMNLVPGQLNPTAIPNAPADWKGTLRSTLDQYSGRPTWGDLPTTYPGQDGYSDEWQNIQNADYKYFGDPNGLLSMLGKYYNQA